MPRARLLVVAVAVASAGAILWLSRTYTFYFDEWTFITTAPGWTLATYFEPHNEHPSILFRLLYTALLNTAGLRSYLPYMAALALAHAANVVLLFELVRRRAGELVALAAALLLAFLGAGWEDLLWAFQVAWLASVALGLGALLLLEHPRRTPAAAALVAASLAFSGIGAVFAVAAAAWLVLVPARRRDLWWFAPVAVAVAVWYVAFGRFGEHPNPPPNATNLVVDPLYAAWGLGQGVAALIGEGGWVGVPLLVLAAAALAWHWRRHGLDPFEAGAAAGLVAFFLITGLTRAQLGYQQSGASRYVYVAAVLWLIVLAGPARDVPWRGTWRPAVAACVFLACFNSAVLLFEFGVAKTAQMQRAVADLQAMEAGEGFDVCVDPNAHADLLVMPQLTVGAYLNATRHYGRPVAPEPVTDRADYETARTNILKPGC